MRVFVTLLAGAMLVGCAPQPAPQSTPTPEPIELVDVDQPAQVFGGDCSAVFTDEALSGIFGIPLINPVMPEDAPDWWFPPIDPQSYLIEQAGGIHCTWGELSTSPDVYPNVVLYVAVVPAGAVSAPEATECVPTEMSQTGCPIDVTTNGLRLSGTTTDIEGVDQLSLVAAVEALFTARASATAPGVAPTPVAGAWHNPVDCDAMAASLDPADFGATEPLQADYTMGTDAYMSAVQVGLQGGRYLPGCSLYADPGGVSFVALGGGAWIRDAVLAQEGATIVDVPGIDLVVETPVDGGGITVDTFDGVNWLQTTWGDPETYPALIALIAALDAQGRG